MNRQILLNNNKIVLELLREEEEDDQLLIHTRNKRRKPISNLFLTRKLEGFFEKLIHGQLATDDIKFREFFRLNHRQFYFVLLLIKNQVQKTPTMRWHEPITAEEKLVVTLGLMWVILLLTASVCILMNVYTSWTIYSCSSTQIIVDDPRLSLSKIDFPAVTICSVNKIIYSKAKELVLKKYEHDPELRKKYENSLYVLGLLQYRHYRDLSLFVENNSMINLPLKNITDLMLTLMPTIDEVFESCYWRGTGYNCSDVIRLQRTEEGFCYSFNSKTSERTTNDSDINPPMAGPNGMLIPLRNNAAGMMTGFEVILKSLITEYFPKDKRSKGFNIMIHTPEDFPDISNSYKLFSELNQSSRISVSVSHIMADESLRWLTEKDRKCFLYQRRSARETNLPSYRSNAVDNCYAKCRLETTYKMCNCTPYFFEVRENVQDCGIEHIQCLSKIDVLMRNVQAPEREPGFPKWSMPVFMNCSCPSPCSFIGYTTELRNFPQDFIGNSARPHTYMHIDIHYKQRFAISYQRFLKYTPQDLLVAFGGMASLFLGCSLISLVEIIHIFYKSLAMLKTNYCTKTRNRTHTSIISKQQQVTLCQQHHSYHFYRSLYKFPNNNTCDQPTIYDE